MTDSEGERQWYQEQEHEYRTLILDQQAKRNAFDALDLGILIPDLQC